MDIIQDSYLSLKELPPKDVLSFLKDINIVDKDFNLLSNEKESILLTGKNLIKLDLTTEGLVNILNNHGFDFNVSVLKAYMLNCTIDKNKLNDLSIKYLVENKRTFANLNYLFSEKNNLNVRKILEKLVSLNQTINQNIFMYIVRSSLEHLDILFLSENKDYTYNNIISYILNYDKSFLMQINISYLTEEKFWINLINSIIDESSYNRGSSIFNTLKLAIHKISLEKLKDNDYELSIKIYRSHPSRLTLLPEDIKDSENFKTLINLNKENPEELKFNNSSFNRPTFISNESYITSLLGSPFSINESNIINPND